MPKGNKKTAAGLGCLVIFGGIFIIAGMVPGFFAFKSLYEWNQAANWTATPATLLAVNLERGDDTYRATARYRYQWDGRDFEGDRVSLFGASDNIGDFHEKTYSRLRNKQRSNKPITVYVDPDNPADSMIIRDMRWGLFAFLMIFPLVFGGAGAGIIAMGIYGKRKEDRKQELQQQIPDEPWRWEPEWQDGVVRAQTGRALWVMVFFAVVWNLISLPLPFFIWEEVIEKSNYAALLGLLFPLVGIGLITWVVRSFLQHRRYGQASLILDTFPGTPGGELSGILKIPASLPAGALLDVSLSCVRRRVSGSGKNRSTREDILWQDRQRIRLAHQHVMNGTRVHLAFPVPEDQPVTDRSTPRNTVAWRVEASADVPGVDFGTTLEVPVYDTGKPPERPTTRTLTSSSAEPADWRNTGVETRFGPRGREFYVPPARHKAMAAVLTLVAIIFSGATLFLWQQDQIFMGVIFVLFAVLLIWRMAASWFMRSRLVPTAGLLRYQRGMLPRGNWREIRSGDIVKVAPKGGTTFGTTKFYDIEVTTRDGKTHKIADTLGGRRDTQAFADMIKDALGLDSLDRQL